ncbi:hypothetical protein QN239_31165 [Mycolicibacterium sp. Y3]
MIMANTVLCDVQVTPDGAVVVIEDVGARGVPGIYAHEAIGCVVTPPRPVHAIWVRTMSMFDGELLGHQVRVRVLVGTDTRGLGRPVYQGEFTVASGVLAIGEARNPDRQLLFGIPATLRVTVLVETADEVIHFSDPPADYPVSGPTGVTVLIEDNPGFTHAVSNTVLRRRWWLRWPVIRRKLHGSSWPPVPLRRKDRCAHSGFTAVCGADVPGCTGRAVPGAEIPV